MSYHPDWQVAAVSSKPSKWANPSSHSLAWGPSRLRTKPIPTDTLHAWRPFCCPNNHENIVIIGNMSLSNEKCLPTKLLGISGGVTLSLRCFLYVSGAWRVSKRMDESGEQQRNFFLLSTRLSGFSLSKPSSAFENVRVPTATGPPRGPPASISLKKALANSQTKTNHHISSKISTFFYLNIAATLI